MNLSDAVLYLNHITELSVASTATDVDLELKKILDYVSKTDVDVTEHIENLDTIQFVIANAFAGFENTTKVIYNAVLDYIEQHEQDLLKQCTQDYQEANDTVDYILNRRRPMSPDTENIILTRSMMYSDWKFPGMVIRPGKEHFIENFVALDPLYVVDTDIELLTPVKERFTPEYQARLRYYVIDEMATDPIFKNLPQNQFGFIFCYNYLNYKPLEVLKRYLQEVFGLLRPGGTFGFSYNNCDFGNAVKLVENHYHTYTPGRLVKSYILELGYDIVYECNSKDEVHWLEISKPGELVSIRGGQSLATVERKKTHKENIEPKYIEEQPKTVDKVAAKIYTQEEIANLQEAAVLLGIDTREHIITQYTPEKLERLVDIRMNSAGIQLGKFHKKLQMLTSKRKKS